MNVLNEIILMGGGTWIQIKVGGTVLTRKEGKELPAVTCLQLHTRAIYWPYMFPQHTPAIVTTAMKD